MTVRNAPERATVQVRLFAYFREVVGSGQVEMPLEPGDTVRDLWARFSAEHPRLSEMTPSAAVNAVYAKSEQRLAAGDEVAFLPPVSGG